MGKAGNSRSQGEAFESQGREVFSLSLSSNIVDDGRPRAAPGGKCVDIQRQRDGRRDLIREGSWWIRCSTLPSNSGTQKAQVENVARSTEAADYFGEGDWAFRWKNREGLGETKAKSGANVM